jgi:hypothetical protein
MELSAPPPACAPELPPPIPLLRARRPAGGASAPRTAQPLLPSPPFLSPTAGRQSRGGVRRQAGEPSQGADLELDVTAATTLLELGPWTCSLHRAGARALASDFIFVAATEKEQGAWRSSRRRDDAAAGVLTGHPWHLPLLAGTWTAVAQTRIRCARLLPPPLRTPPPPSVPARHPRSRGGSGQGSSRSGESRRTSSSATAPASRPPQPLLRLRRGPPLPPAA